MLPVRSLIALFLVPLTFFSGASACGGAAPATLVLSEKDAGKQVQLKPGQKLDVVLAGNPTTGYTWEVASGGQPVLKSLGEADFKLDSSAVGSGGVFTFHFEAAGAGQGVLRLVYRRPWEQSELPVQTFDVPINVTE